MILDQCMCLAVLFTPFHTGVVLGGSRLLSVFKINQQIESQSNQDTNQIQFRVLLPSGCQGLKVQQKLVDIQ